MGRQTFYLHNFPHRVRKCVLRCGRSDGTALPTDNHIVSIYTPIALVTHKQQKKERLEIQSGDSMLIGSGGLVAFCLYWDKVSMFIICYDFRFVFFRCHFSFRFWTFGCVVVFCIKPD